MTDTTTHGSAQNVLLAHRQVLDRFAAHLRQYWTALPATDRHLDAAQRMTGIRADDLLDYLLGLKEPDLAHLILLADYCGCKAVDLWPSRKELTNG